LYVSMNRCSISPPSAGMIRGSVLIPRTTRPRSLYAWYSAIRSGVSIRQGKQAEYQKFRRTTLPR